MKESVPPWHNRFLRVSSQAGIRAKGISAWPVLINEKGSVF